MALKPPQCSFILHSLLFRNNKNAPSTEKETHYENEGDR